MSKITKCKTCGGSGKVMVLQQITGEEWFLPHKLEPHEEYRISTLDKNLCHHFVNGKMGDAYNVKYIPCPDCPPSGELAKLLTEAAGDILPVIESSAVNGVVMDYVRKLTGYRQGVGRNDGSGIVDQALVLAKQAAARIDTLEKACRLARGCAEGVIAIICDKGVSERSKDECLIVDTMQRIWKTTKAALGQENSND